MKNVLVIGASGALGTALLNELKKNGSWNLFTAGRTKTPGTNSIECDILSKAELSDTYEIAKPDLIFNLAAAFSDNLEEAYPINVGTAKNLLDLSLSSPKKSRVVLIGSAAEYGVVRQDENPISENHVLYPVSAYGVTKAWQTQMMGMYASQGADVVCARIFNLIGPGISERLFAGKIRAQIEKYIKGECTVINTGPLSAIRDYISTTEAAAQLVTIAQNGKSGEVYHVGSGEPVSMRDLLKNELEKSGIADATVNEDNRNSNRKGYDVPVIFADMSKTRSLI